MEIGAPAAVRDTAKKEQLMPQVIGVPRETAPDEKRVATVPDVVEKLVKLGFRVAVQSGAGEAANFPDEAYRAAGAEIVADVWPSADIVFKVRAPTMEEVERMRDGATSSTTLVSFIWPAQNPQLMQALAAKKATVLAMDSVPRISRAQKLDALSSMANITGYKGTLLAAAELVGDRAAAAQQRALLKDPDPAVRHWAAIGLAADTAAAKSARRELQQALRDASGPVRVEAAGALLASGADTAAALDVRRLEQILGGLDERRRVLVQEVSGLERGLARVQSSAQELASQAEALQDTVSRFQLDPGTRAAGEYEEGETIPVANTEKEGYVDRWIVYGKVDGQQLFTAKELTLQPGAKCTIQDGGAYGWITVQGSGKIGKLTLQSPVMIRFGEMTEDEVFVTAKAASAGVTFENTGTEPLVGLRYFGPNAQPNAPENGAWRKSV